ncbi:MAG: hypothetical protein LBU73_05110 [Helicobacteraceae bacterium]|jgi:hypothetical protein|nr:hypothetical protein [Helicobacteraceae bacterium]
MRKTARFSAIFSAILISAALRGDIHAAVSNVKVANDGAALNITLLLDAPFKGEIDKIKEDSQLMIVLNNLTSPNPYIFAPRGDLVSSVRISAQENSVVARIQPKMAIAANTTTSNNGKTITIRIEADKNAAQINSIDAAVSSLVSSAGSQIPLSDDFLMKDSYLLAAIFVAALLLLWIIVRLFKGGGDSWLLGKKSSSIMILWQKPIDAKNKFVFARFRGKEYLLLISQTGGFLVDVSGDEEPPVSSGGKSSKPSRSNAPQNPIDNESFEAMLRANSVKLSDFLKQEDDSKKR